MDKVLRQCNIFIGRSSYRRCSVRKGVLRNFAKLTGKHLCQSLFSLFPVNFVKFLRTLFLQNTSGRLLLRLLSPFCPLNPRLLIRFSSRFQKSNLKTLFQYYSLLFVKAAPEVFYKKVVLINFAIFSGKGLYACNLIKKRLQHRYFPVSTAKFLRTPFLKNICETAASVFTKSIQKFL